MNGRWVRERRLLAAAASLGAIGGAPAASRWDWQLPAGITAPSVPAANPMSTAKVALGRRLFYDADLSIDGTMSCATWHSQRHGFADDNRTRPSVDGSPGRRNVPGLVNIAWASPLTWADPRLMTLEDQVAVPVLGDHPVEMGMKGRQRELARRLSADACYKSLFTAAFPKTRGRIDMTGISQAIAAFERSMISHETAFDRSQSGGPVLPVAAQRGSDVFFGAGDCAACHAGTNFSDYRFHAGVADADDRGLAEKSGRRADSGRFRTPGLRNVALTAPYFHDGSSTTLAVAIRRHAQARLSNGQLADIEAFLGTLTDVAFVSEKRFGYPDLPCAEGTDASIG